MDFLLNKLRFCPYNKNSPAIIKLWGKYADCFQDLNKLGISIFSFVDESSFRTHLRYNRGYVAKGSYEAIAERRYF